MEPPNAPNAILPRRSSIHRQNESIGISSSSSTMNPSSSLQHQPTMRTVSSQRRIAVPPYTTVGQFSYAPTTQTTVVTTTTTTTTNFPQMVFKPPRSLNELDPKEFPLAATPTPASLKRFCFDVNGKPTYFRESEDPEVSLRQVLFRC